MADDALRALYLGSTWSVRASGGTLRLAPGVLAPRPLRPSAIVTAYNPGSLPTPLAANRAAARALVAWATALGVPHLPARAHGTGPQRLLWSEPALALLGPPARAAAVKLGREWAQNAVVTVDHAGRVEIVVTRPGFCGLAVGKVLSD